MLFLFSPNMEWSASQHSWRHICIFVSLTVKAVHLEVVPDLTSETFITPCDLPWASETLSFGVTTVPTTLVRSRNFTNFFAQRNIPGIITEFCASGVVFHPWGLLVPWIVPLKVSIPISYRTKSLQQFWLRWKHAWTTDPWWPSTPGHFNTGQPLGALNLPDPFVFFRPVSLHHRWHLCQNLVRHFWQRWSREYL